MTGRAPPDVIKPVVVKPVVVEPLADDAWLVQLGSTIDDTTSTRVHALAARLRDARLPWLRDLVPAYTSLGVFFDPGLIEAEAVRACLLLQLDASIDHLVTAALTGVIAPGRTIEIPVAYGGQFGPDLLDAAGELGIPPDTLVQRHAGAIYTVAMIGFAPGFPYLSGLEPALALPRLATPRTQVAAGSVAIGGAQTGIYPRASPGGWRLLGRTPLRLFDPFRDPPALLAPGDHVRFRAIDDAEFMSLSEHDA